MNVTSIYYLFTFLIQFGLGMTVTTYVPFLQSIGLSLGEVSLINGVFWVVIILAELPTGMLADGRSRAWSLKLGAVFAALGALSYGLAHGVFTAMLSESILGIGIAFLSGAKEAWIADALAREGKAGELRHVYATDGIVNGTSTLVGGVIGTCLSLVHYRLIWIPMVVFSLLAWGLCHRFMNRQGEPMHRINEWTAFRSSLTLLRQSRALAWVVGIMILTGAMVSFNHFWAPYFKPQVGQLGLPWIWTIIYLGFIPGGLIVRRMTVTIGNEGSFLIAAVLLTGIGLGATCFFSGLVGPLICVSIHEIGRGMIKPLTDSFVQHRVDSSYRATFSSLLSLLGRIGFAITPFITWLLITGQPDSPDTIASVWIVSGLVLTIGALVFAAIRPRS